MSETKHVKVLDHGFVELRDHMGSDQSIVDSARVSIAGDEVKAVSTNKGLIRYLYRNRHSTPFESVYFTFAIKCPMLVARQWMRHRTASYNEISARYGKLPAEFYIPDRYNLQAKDNHQGSAASELEPFEKEMCKDQIIAHSEDSYTLYEDLLDVGLSRELARSVLPVNVYTQFHTTVSLRNLFHFLGLRQDPHAQKEIRVYADAIFEIIKEVCPLACQAYLDYSKGSVTFSRAEMEILRSLLDERSIDSMLEYSDTEDLGSKREVNDFLCKLGIENG